MTGEFYAEDQPSEPPGLDVHQLANYERVAVYGVLTSVLRRDLREHIAMQESAHADALRNATNSRAAVVSLARLAGRIEGLKIAWEIVTGDEWRD